MNEYIQQIRRQFPLLSQMMYGHPLVYLDNAATTQKPQVVLDAMSTYYKTCNANIHRGAHSLSNSSTEQVESVRSQLRRLLNACSVKEIIFTSGATASLNLIASTYGSLQPGDEILVSVTEHHSNLLPWQRLCQNIGAHLRVIPADDQGNLLLDHLDTLLTNRTKIVAIGYVSNVLGTIHPVRYITQRAHAVGAVVVVDAAQAFPHFRIDVKELDCDFLVVTAHKAYGPTGIGMLYGKHVLLEQLLPYQVGGGMVQEVTWSGAIYSELPHRLEAGTPNIAGIIGWGAALSWMESLNYTDPVLHEQSLLNYLEDQLQGIPRVRLVGAGDGTAKKVSISSFTIDGLNDLDAGMLLDAQGIAVRTGNHCAQLFLSSLGFAGLIRASLAVYNTDEDIDRLVQALKKIIL